MAFVQRRKGPDVVGSFGLLQPLADGSKLILKEPISPSSANFSLFRMAPVATFMLSLVARAVVPFDYGTPRKSEPRVVQLSLLLAVLVVLLFGLLCTAFANRLVAGFFGLFKAWLSALVGCVNPSPFFDFDCQIAGARPRILTL
ncbi:uncharacterized protein LOC116117793 [Pistacia vera]|uniref:uncharacterized protein LOC116117793 n=1 Tax=Pistacia vera TaxID=55513 RepID=UPI0012639BB2|nr:uncharacterized protein LOC116117793 [Pistacia vera]